MYPYLFYYVFGLIALLTLLFDVLNAGTKKTYDRAFVTIYVFLGLLVAFRYGTGPDTPRYMYAYYYIMPDLYDITINDVNSYRFMPGYTYFVAFIKTLFGDFVFLQIAQAILYFTSFYLLLKRLELRRFYLLLVFYGYNYFVALSAIRECLGLSFCFFALLFYLDQKYKLYYLLVFIGFMFHSGVFVFFFIPLIRYFKTLKLKYIFLIVLFFVAAVLSMSFIRGVVGGLGDGSIARYAKSEGEGFSLSSLIASISYLIIIYYYCFRFNRNEKHIDFIYLGIVSVLVTLFSGIVPILYRYTAHFSIFFYYCINMIFLRMKRDNIWRIYLIMLFFFSPIARFESVIKRPNMVYCSVFNDEKKYYDMIIDSASPDM